MCVFAAFIIASSYPPVMQKRKGSNYFHYCVSRRSQGNSFRWGIHPLEDATAKTHFPLRLQ